MSIHNTYYLSKNIGHTGEYQIRNCLVHYRASRVSLFELSDLSLVKKFKQRSQYRTQASDVLLCQYESLSKL